MCRSGIRREREVQESLTQRWDRMKSPREGIERGREKKNERKEMSRVGEPVKWLKQE